MNHASTFALILIASFPTFAPAEVAAEGPSLTVYSTADPAGFDPQQFIAQQRQGIAPGFAWQVPGFGVVRERRKVQLNAGVNSLRITDVAQFIDPTTVSFSDLTAPDGTSVLEQNFEFDLVSPDKLLEKYLDRDVTLLQTLGDKVDTIRGRLLSATGGQLVLQTADGVRVVAHSQQIQLGELPGGLITRPTLVWKVSSEKGGAHDIQTSYQTAGITWRSDYNLTLNAEENRADLGAWVTLMNLSGAGYPNARLKLIAGDVQRIQPRPDRMMYRARGAVPELSAAQGFEEKAFFEYHLYTLPRRTDVLANTTQQIMLFPTARDVPVEKLLVYYGLPEAAYWTFVAEPQQDRNFGNQSNPKVDVYIRFRNEKAANLGMPLPRGKVRVYKRDDADDSLEFIGEDLIDHTPRDEKVLIKLGQSFDVVGQRTQTNFSIDTSRRTMVESFEIELRNHKDAAQKVVIKENLFRWTTWEMTYFSDKYEKVDSRTIHFEVTVPPHYKKTVSYTVKYTW